MKQYKARREPLPEGGLIKLVTDGALIRLRSAEERYKAAKKNSDAANKAAADIDRIKAEIESYGRQP